MRRFTSVILSILLGALAVAIGMGIFLRMANDDRARLADLAAKAQQESQQAKETSQNAINNANGKLEAANQEISKAQEALKALQVERDLLMTAEPLVPSAPRAMRSWEQALDLQLGVSLKFPAGSTIETNDHTALTLTTASSDIQVGEDGRWLSITPHETRLENELFLAFSTSTPVSYVVDGHLLIGRHGRLMGKSGETFVLRAQYGGRPTQLIWARDPSGRADNTMLLNVFSTLSFKK